MIGTEGTDFDTRPAIATLIRVRHEFGTLKPAFLTD